MPAAPGSARAHAKGGLMFQFCLLMPTSGTNFSSSRFGVGTINHITA
jgi:hypothetical protein